MPLHLHLRTPRRPRALFSTPHTTTSPQMALRNAALVAAVALVALCACALAQAPCAATTTPAAPLKLHAKKVRRTRWPPPTWWW